MRAIVTGGTGAVGRAFLPRLLDDGWDVTALTRNPARPELPRHPRLSYHAADFEHPESLASLERNPPPCDVIFHLAASLDYAGDPTVLHRTNAGGTARMLAIARAAGARRFVYASSIEAAGSFTLGETPPPLGATRRALTGYGASKQAAEQLVTTADGISAIALRIGNVYGPGWFNFVIEFCRSILFRDRLLEYLPVYANRYWSPVHNDDVSAGLLAAAASLSGGIVNLVGEGATVGELFRLCADGLGVPFPALPRRPLDGFYVGLTSYWQRRIHRRCDTIGYIMAPSWPRIHRGFGMAESSRLLGWRPRMSLRCGIRENIAWARRGGLLPPA